MTVAADDAQPVLIHNLFNNDKVLYQDNTTSGVSVNDVNVINISLPGAYGNVAGDPKFSKGSDTFHLREGSAALDRGLLEAVTSVDIDGDARPGKDHKADIGADEANSSYTPAKDKIPPVSFALTAKLSGAVIYVSYVTSGCAVGC